MLIFLGTEGVTCNFILCLTSSLFHTGKGNLDRRMRAVVVFVIMELAADPLAVVVPNNASVADTELRR